MVVLKLCWIETSILAHIWPRKPKTIYIIPRNFWKISSFRWDTRPTDIISAPSPIWNICPDIQDRRVLPHSLPFGSLNFSKSRKFGDTPRRGKRNSQPHSTLHALHTPHFTLHTLHFTLYTLHCSVHSTLHTLHFTLDISVIFFGFLLPFSCRSSTFLRFSLRNRP